MQSIIIVLVVLAAVGGGMATLWVLLGRRLRDLTQDLQDRQTTDNEQALRTALDELARQSASANEAGVQRAVATVLDVADARLADQTQAGSRELAQHKQEIANQLEQVTRLVAELQKEKSSQHGELLSRLEQTTQEQRKLADLTGDLQQALANPKARGNWGERTAEDILRSAGFVEGVSYQRAAVTEAGTVPDFTFLLPHGRVVHMDVKFPISRYLDVLAAQSDQDRRASTKAFLGDVRTRIAEITRRSYIDPERTIDTILVFIPNEAVYSFIHEHDPDLIDRALGQRVVLCSPFTLFAVLGVIRQAVQNFTVEQTSREVLAVLEGFKEQWANYNEAVDRVGKSLDAARNHLDKVQTTRRNQMQRQIDKVDDLQQRCLDVEEGDADGRLDLTDAAAGLQDAAADIAVAEVTSLTESRAS